PSPSLAKKGQGATGLQQTRAHGSFPGDEVSRASGRLRILLAEDNVFNQKLAIRLLEKHRHTVVLASNGLETLSALERQPFDLVLMDVQMPEMDGLEATRRIRAQEGSRGGFGPEGKRIPIIAMTAYAMKGDRERCLEAGMDGYVA